MRSNPRAFIATAVAFDQEMRDRIAAHQSERGDRFQLVEEPTDLAGAVAGLGLTGGVALIDCLTVWLGNLMHEHGDESGDYAEVRSFLEMLEQPPMDLVIVSNEVGMGVIPENAMARRYRDLAGTVNQQVAQRADTVVFVVSGVPMIIKQNGSET